MKKSGKFGAKVSKSSIMEMTRKNNNSKEGLRFISDKIIPRKEVALTKKSVEILSKTTGGVYKGGR